MPSLYYSADFLPDTAYEVIEEISKLVGKGIPCCKADVDEVLESVRVLFRDKEINLERLDKVVKKMQEFEEASKTLRNINKDIETIFEKKDK